MKLIFATGNAHKLAEVRTMLPRGIEVVGMRELNFLDEIPETSNTIEGNSLQKAEYLAKKLNGACFAEDTGLFIEALHGEPGVYSARYAGVHATFADNVEKVIRTMKDVANRKAYFKTVITYYDAQGTYTQFEGLTRGEITLVPCGAMGFGYDPVFMPEGASQTFAQMSIEQKNKFSHRRKSFDLFANYLRTITV